MPRDNYSLIVTPDQLRLLRAALWSHRSTNDAAALSHAEDAAFLWLDLVDQIDAALSYIQEQETA